MRLTTTVALPKKSIRSGTSQLVVGARAPSPARACSTLNLKPLDAATVSRFALIAGEGARAPSISLSLSAYTTFCARQPGSYPDCDLQDRWYILPHHTSGDST